MNQKEYLEKNNFAFKKKFGQNFLKDQNILDKIVLKSEVDQDTMVIEIGVGAGALTLTLLSKVKNLIGYEIDTTLKPVLEERLNEYSNKEIIFDDFLKRDVKKDLEKYDYKKLYVVANLPYYITTPIIEKIINDNLNVDKIVVMVQKEVGDRFNAKPGSKEYGSLSIFLNYYFDIRKLLDVPRTCFIPQPNVDSIIIEMSKTNKDYNVSNEYFFFKLVRDAFQFKRKNIRNNLKKYDLNIIEDCLEKYGYDLSVRAEELTIEQFIDISNELTK